MHKNENHLHNSELQSHSDPVHVQAHHAGHPSRSLRKFKITPGIGECKEDLFGFCGVVPIALLSINSFYMVLTSSNNNNIRAK